MSDVGAESRALRGLGTQTARVILAGKRAKVRLKARKSAIAVSLCQRSPWAAASLAHPTHALLPLLTGVEAFATVILVSL